ncbi:hypothetical protein LTR28_004812 [Elasticomyces elasticus]|nr:hypothetical protein LTR28_004812 [Elasticomyces elasticus]
MSTLEATPKAAQASLSPRISTVPLLRDDASSASNATTERARNTLAQDSGQSESTKAAGKRRLFGFGKKKDDKSLLKTPPQSGGMMAATASTASAMRPVSPGMSSQLDPKPAPASPQEGAHPYSYSTTHIRPVRSASPRMPSPASSQIFERDVQEDTIPSELSPAIPAHMRTEDHIPPVLEASSLAITDDHLNPDDVEIVMHSAHQPAGVSVPEGSHHDIPALSSQDDLFVQSEGDDTASNYGALDPNDVRRLSFISFADVIQAEHAEGKDSVHLMSLSSNTPSIYANRAPSPIRSPVSLSGVGTPPPTGPSSSGASFKAGEISPPRGPSSPLSSHSGPAHHELTIETMRQALRRTGSRDLSGAKSAPMSAVSAEENGEHAFRRGS